MSKKKKSALLPVLPGLAWEFFFLFSFILLKRPLPVCPGIVEELKVLQQQCSIRKPNILQPLRRAAGQPEPFTVQDGGHRS